MFKRALVGLAVCGVSSALWAQAPAPPITSPPPGVVVPGPPPGYYSPPSGYHPVPGVVHAVPVAAPVSVVPVVVPIIRYSPYNPRIDLPPFTMVPDFTVFDRAAPPPTIVERTVPRTAERTLYERLGGETAIRAVIDDFVTRTAANPKVNFTRKGTPAEWKPTPEGIDRLKKNLLDLTGMVTGGPQRYSGKPLKEGHRDMKITQDEFDATVSDLKASLDKFNVPTKEKDELIKIVNSTAGDIVERKRN